LTKKSSLSSPIHRKNKRAQLISPTKRKWRSGYEQQQQTCIDQLTENKQIKRNIFFPIFIYICRLSFFQREKKNQKWIDTSSPLKRKFHKKRNCKIHGVKHRHTKRKSRYRTKTTLKGMRRYSKEKGIHEMKW